MLAQKKSSPAFPSVAKSPKKTENMTNLFAASTQLPLPSSALRGRTANSQTLPVLSKLVWVGRFRPHFIFPRLSPNLHSSLHA